MTGHDSHPHLVALDAEHPGFRDRDYRRRRDAIARVALEHQRGNVVPQVEYSDEEHALWARILATLDPLHEQWAASSLLAVKRRLPLDRQRIPQLRDLNLRLHQETGFAMEPVAGLVDARDFLSELADGVFLSTQYIRHTSAPFYTPEPDVVHELVGHAATLAAPEFAALSESFGRAARAADETRLARIERLYWYTLEYGVVREGGDLKAVGAGLLSSHGELAAFASAAELQDFDPERAASMDYDPTAYQPRLFVAASIEDMFRRSEAWLERA
jgi:phenylalanine-4-hydroxylase